MEAPGNGNRLGLIFVDRKEKEGGEREKEMENEKKKEKKEKKEKKKEKKEKKEKEPLLTKLYRYSQLFQHQRLVLIDGNRALLTDIHVEEPLI